MDDIAFVHAEVVKASRSLDKPLHIDLQPPLAFFSGRRHRPPTTSATPLQHRRMPFTTASTSTLPAHRRCQHVFTASAPSPPGARLVPGCANVSKYVLVSVQDMCRVLTCIAHLMQVTRWQCPLSSPHVRALERGSPPILSYMMANSPSC